MIRILTLLTFLFTSSILTGQITIEAEVDSILTTGFSNQFEIVGKINFTNNGVDTTSFTWIKDDSNLVEGWDSFIYDQIQCSFLSVDTRGFDLFPGQVGFIHFHLYPNGFCGEGYGLMTLTDDSDSNNFVEMRYDFIVNNSDGSACELSTSVSNPKLDNIQVFPNPANDFFTLTDTPPGLESIHLYDIRGRRLKTYWLMGALNFDISDLVSGIYLVNLTNSKGENLKTFKLHKN